MAWPTTHQGLVDAGYVWVGEGNCRACRESILFYRTPNGKRMPINRKDFKSHFATCTQPDRFRQRLRKPIPAKSGELF